LQAVPQSVSGDGTSRTSSLARSSDAQWAEWSLEGPVRGEQEPPPGSWPIKGSEWRSRRTALSVFWTSMSDC